MKDQGGTTMTWGEMTVAWTRMCSPGGEQLSSSGHIERVEPTGFTDKLYVICKNESKALRDRKDGFGI